MIVFLLCYTILSDQDVTVCYRSCPNSIKGSAIKIFGSDDISYKIKNYFTDTKVNIYFYNATAFTFTLNLMEFQGYTIEFHKLVESSCVSIEIDGTASPKLAESLIFKQFDVIFYSSLQSPQLQLHNLEIENSTIDLYSIEPKLVAENIIADNSINTFSTVQISNLSSASSTGIKLNIESSPSLSVQAIDNGAILTYGQINTTYSFDDNLASKFFEIQNSSFCKFEYKGSENSNTIQFSIKNINHFNFLGAWPNSAVIDFLNTEDTILCANSTVLPVSLKKAPKATIILTQPVTTVTGEIGTPVVFSKEENEQIRKTVTFLKAFSGSSIDLGSSFHDVVLSGLTTDISGTGPFPFVFRVGQGGSSTLKVTQSTTTTTSKGEISIAADFESFLSDEHLHNLISKKWDVLTLTGVTFSSSQIAVKLPSDPFIHGFVSHDSCLACKIEGNKIVLSATSPSLLPLNICYDGNNGKCDTDESFKIESLDSISSYFKNGIRNVFLHFKAGQAASIDLRSIDSTVTGFGFTLIGYDGATIGSIQMSENTKMAHLKLNNLMLGTTTFFVSEVTFSGCKPKDSSSSFVFNNLEKIHGDDDFVVSISPHMSGNKFKTFEYNMNQFNSVTISDSKFIFHESESSDSRDPSEVSRSLFDFLDIKYDVGKRKSYNNDDLHLTMQTDDPPSFNVTFSNDLSKPFSSVPELALFSWSRTKDANFRAYFNHNQIDAKIILTSNYKPPQLIPIGTGILTYETRFQYDTSICSTPDADKAKCPKGSTYVSYDQLNDKLSETSGENVAIYIMSTNSNHPTIDLKNVNEKLALFRGLSTDLTDVIEISASQQVDEESTQMTFSHLVIKKASSQSNQLKLGNIEIYESQVDSSFNEVDLNVRNFGCEFDSLSKFKQISVSGEANVNGTVPNEQSSVQFSSNSNHLISTIKSDASVLVGNKYIKIGGAKFSFNSVNKEKSDVVLDFESTTKEVVFERDEECTESAIPSIQIRKASESTFTFNGKWKADSTRRSVFTFSHLNSNQNKIYVSSENTPVSIVSSANLTIVSKSEIAGITGNIELDSDSSASSINVLYEGVPKTTLYASSIIIKNNVDIKFNQPNIAFDVLEFTSNEEQNLMIQPEFFSSVDGDSIFSIHNEMKSVSISPFFKIQMPITQQSNDQKFIDYCNNEHLLLKMNPENAASFNPQSISFIGTKPTSHGFTVDNIKISVDSTRGSISIKMKQNPLYLPYVFCFEHNENICESSLNEENMNDFAQFIPSGTQYIKFIFGRQNANSLNLNTNKIKGSNVLIEQANEGAQLSVKMTLGNGIISLLSLNKVIGEVTDSTTFEIEKIELSNGSKIDGLDRIKEISIDYKSSWKQLSLEPCSNKVILNVTESLVTFTNQGIVIGNDTEIQYSSYPNLHIQLPQSAAGTPAKLESSDDLNDDLEITIYSSTNSFILGSKWSHWRATPSVKIEFDRNVNTNNIFVKTSSYPFLQIPQLMKASTIQLDESVLPYKVDEDVSFNNLHSKLDFSHIKDTSKLKVLFKSFTFEGTSSLTISGVSATRSSDDYYVTIENVKVNDNSFVILDNIDVSEKLTLDPKSTISGNFEASNEIVMNWRLYSFPKIIFGSKQSKKLPRTIDVVFNEQSISGHENEYDDFLYKQRFEIVRTKSSNQCDDLKSAVRFISSKVSCFASNGIFEAKCKDGNLEVYGERRIQEGGEAKNEAKKVNVGIIVGIVIATIAIIAVAVVIVIVCSNKKANHEDTSASVSTISQSLLF